MQVDPSSVNGGSTSSCLFSCFLSLRIKYVRYFMAIWWMCFKSVLIFFGGILRSFCACMECL